MSFDYFKDALESFLKKGRKIAILGLFGNIEVNVTVADDKITFSSKDGGRVYEVDRFASITPQNGEVLISTECGEPFVIISEN